MCILYKHSYLGMLILLPSLEFSQKANRKSWYKLESLSGVSFAEFSQPFCFLSWTDWFEEGGGGG